MRKTIVILFLIFCFCDSTLAEKIWTKNEIKSYYIEKAIKYPYKTDYRKNFPKFVVEYINTLTKNGIDSIGAYYIPNESSYLDTCNCTIEGCIQWMDKGLIFQRKIINGHLSQIMQLEQSAFIDFYAANMYAIEIDVLLYVLSVKSSWDSKTKTETISEEIRGSSGWTDFKLYCRLNRNSVCKTISEDLLVDQTYPFLQENIESITNQWRLLVHKQLFPIDKK